MSLQSPYLMVNETTTHDVVNPLSVSKADPPAPQVNEGAAGAIASLMAPGMPVVVFHAASGLFAFLSFALMGSIPAINFGTPDAADLLDANDCADDGIISGSMNFNPFRLCLAIGILVWLYSMVSIFLQVRAPD